MKALFFGRTIITKVAVIAINQEELENHEEKNQQNPSCPLTVIFKGIVQKTVCSMVYFLVWCDVSGL